MSRSWDVDTPYNGSHKIEITKSCVVITRYFNKVEKKVTREETPETRIGGYRDAPKMVISEKTEYVIVGKVIVDTNIIPLRSIQRIHVQNVSGHVGHEYRQHEVVAMTDKSDTCILIYLNKDFHVAKCSTAAAPLIAEAIVEAMNNLG